jgi:hypothetical protein
VKVIIFTRRNITPRWRYIANQLSCAEVKVVGLLDDGCDINLMPSFYEFYHRQDTESYALTVVGEDKCQEIIRRCRLLRNLKKSIALKLIGAFWLTLERLIDQSQPDVLLSTLVDFYVPDILQRILEQRKIRFIGMCAGILKNQMNFSALGEYNFIREPDRTYMDWAEKEILKPTFSPWVVSRKYNWNEFARSKLFWDARSILLRMQSFWNKDPLNPEYMITHQPGDDYYIRWSDWKIVNYLDTKWEEKLRSVAFDKRVFIGLQYNPECSTDYWVRDLKLADWISSITEITKVLTSTGFTIFLKDHPSMFGLRRKDIYEILSQFKNVIFVPYEVKSQELIDKCKTTFTWTGTIGIQAALAGRCTVTSTTYYTTKEDFIIIRSWDDIALLAKNIDEFQLPIDLDQVRERVLYKLCSASVPGGSDWLGFDINHTDLATTNSLIESLNLYLPQFAKPS